ncbi:hypothetical protein QL285_045428 [Trifolium repens]|nr:hypothetical protein QL285_045428 [Trifolium repens]
MPHFVSALSEYVLQTELPRGWKIPKFTKFAGDTSESTVEHIARYLTEAGDLTNNENLRMKYFPNSLTKNAFTWFTTLPPHSIFNWNQLERVFHEQFYMGQSKISLKELASVRRKTPAGGEPDLAGGRTETHFLPFSCTIKGRLVQMKNVLSL